MFVNAVYINVDTTKHTVNRFLVLTYNTDNKLSSILIKCFENCKIPCIFLKFTGDQCHKIKNNIKTLQITSDFEYV